MLKIGHVGSQAQVPDLVTLSPGHLLPSLLVLLVRWPCACYVRKPLACGADSLCAKHKAGLTDSGECVWWGAEPWGWLSLGRGLSQPGPHKSAGTQVPWNGNVVGEELVLGQVEA